MNNTVWGFILVCFSTHLITQQEVAATGGDISGAVDLPVTDQSENFFKVYLNPTSGRFTLEMNLFDASNKVMVEVYGMRDERILRQEIPGDIDQHSLTLEGHLPGIYFIRVAGGDQVGMQRILKR